MASSLFGTNQIIAEDQNGMNQRIQQAKSLMGAMKGISNQQDMLLLMAKKNPNMKGLLQLVAKHNSDPKEAFYALAKEKGVDPESIIESLKQ